MEKLEVFHIHNCLTRPKKAEVLKRLILNLNNLDSNENIITAGNQIDSASSDDSISLTDGVCIFDSVSRIDSLSLMQRPQRVLRPLSVAAERGGLAAGSLGHDECSRQHRSMCAV